MYKLLILALIYFMILPLWYVGTLYGWVVPLMIMFPSLIFMFGVLITWFHFRKKITLNIAPSGFIVPTHKFILCFVLIYIFGRLDLINNLIGSFIDGDVFGYLRFATQNRYENINGRSLLFHISTIAFMVTCSLLGAYSGSKKFKMYFFPLFIFFTIVEMSESARAGFVMGLVLFAAHFIARRSHIFNNTSFMKLTAVSVILVVLGVSVMAGLQYTRVSHRDMAWNIVANKIPGYTLRPHAALVEWVKDDNCCDYSLGLNTFGAIGKRITGVGNQDGFYDQQSSLLGTTNIFTFMRGVINDFGFFLPNVLFLFLGMYMFKVSVVRTTILGYIAFITVFSIFAFPFISPFSYSTFMVAFSLSALILVRRPVHMPKVG